MSGIFCKLWFVCKLVAIWWTCCSETLFNLLYFFISLIPIDNDGFDHHHKLNHLNRIHAFFCVRLHIIAMVHMLAIRNRSMSSQFCQMISSVHEIHIFRRKCSTYQMNHCQKSLYSTAFTTWCNYIIHILKWTLILIDTSISVLHAKCCVFETNSLEVIPLRIVWGLQNIKNINE